jgi:hypothetical protein
VEREAWRASLSRFPQDGPLLADPCNFAGTSMPAQTGTWNRTSGTQSLAAPTTKLKKHTIFNAQEQSAKAGANTVRRRPNNLPGARACRSWPTVSLSQRDNVVYVLR